MADVVPVHTGQRVVIKFLTMKGSIPIEIHRHFRTVYAEMVPKMPSCHYMLLM